MEKIFIKTDLNNKVIYRHNFPLHEKWGLGKAETELKLEGILVDSIPEPVEQTGKIAELYYDSVSGLHYKYIDKPVAPEDLQQEEINQLKLENAELMMKSAITDMEIETIKNENAELMFRLANLEMGGIL